MRGALWAPLCCAVPRKRFAVASFGLAALLSSAGLADAQTSFWATTVTPAVAETANDAKPVTLGLKFQSDVAGFASGVRFYKGPNNTGAHVGTLWNASGTALASVTFSGETESGWQQANFSAPVSITANTPYIVSYFAPKGLYANNASYPWSSLSAGNLHVVGGAPGVYAYGATNTFPTNSWSGSNYWVDVVFTTSSPVSVSGTLKDGAGASVKMSGDASLATVADPSGKYSFTGVSSGNYVITPQKSGVTFSPANRNVTLAAANVPGQDFAGTAAHSLWPNSPTPAVSQISNDRAAVNLGVSFYSDVPGFVSAVRFYKGANNGGPHTGALWDAATGSQIATADFTNESASGWQQANFAAPVTISPNTHYVISYLAPKGAYAADASYPWSNVNPAPLHFSSLSPSFYAYGSKAAFPNQTYNGTNYWVDVVFVPGAASGGSNAGTMSVSGSVAGAGATLTLSGGSSILTTSAIAGGTYTFGGLANGTYQVTPTQSGYTFNPPSSTVTVNGSPVAGVNFAAAAATGAGATRALTLSWSASASPGIAGYNVYRSNATGGPYTKLNSAVLTALSYTDATASSSSNYYYVTTAVSASGSESAYSNEAAAVVKP